MLSDQPGPLEYLKAILLIGERGERALQRHALYCLWIIDQGKPHVPPACLPASLKGACTAPRGMLSEWLPMGLHFRIAEITFAEFTRIICEDKKAT
jgi:hypothetical protein